MTYPLTPCKFPAKMRRSNHNQTDRSYVALNTAQGKVDLDVKDTANFNAQIICKGTFNGM